MLELFLLSLPVGICAAGLAIAIIVLIVAEVRDE